MSTTEPGFYAVRTRALKREGLTGKRVLLLLCVPAGWGSSARKAARSGSIRPISPPCASATTRASPASISTPTSCAAAGPSPCRSIPPSPKGSPLRRHHPRPGGGRRAIGLHRAHRARNVGLRGLAGAGADGAGVPRRSCHRDFRARRSCLVGSASCPRCRAPSRLLLLLWNTTARLAPRPIKELGELDRQLP